MHTQAVKQASESNSMVAALEALGKSMARWTDKGDQLVTAIPGLSRRSARMPRSEERGGMAARSEA